MSTSAAANEPPPPSPDTKPVVDPPGTGHSLPNIPPPTATSQTRLPHAAAAHSQTHLPHPTSNGPSSRPSFDMGASETFTTRSIPPPSSGHLRTLEHRVVDDVELMKAERVASHEPSVPLEGDDLYRSQSMRRNETVRTRREIEQDGGDLASVSTHAERPPGPWKPKNPPTTRFAKIVKKIHQSSVLVRYFTYIVPVVLILLIPLLLGAFVYEERTVGGVYMMWFMIWLEIVWLCLWAGRIVSKMFPYAVYFLMSAVSNGAKKWMEMARALEVHSTMFLWWLGIYCSFLPTMRNHHEPGHLHETYYWEKTGNIVLLSLFICAILNLVEKILIQLIAISFHQRTYADRIELNKFQISSLAKLYAHAKQKEKELRFAEQEDLNEKAPVGALTPMVVLQGAGRAARQGFNKVGDVVGKIAGDFTGRNVLSSTSPQQVVITLLQTTEGSNALARRLFRAFRHPEFDHVREEELSVAFGSEEEGEAAFSMFDRDMNGDISCEEMEMACVEIGRERKAISASLKDLDSVISRFDACLTFFVVAITIVVFLSLISKSTAGVLTSASSSILALSWLFSGTAQEFLASLVFVFVKHPFDVGDRVDIYNTGTNRIDTFYVKEIALMYTEFKKPEGHVVQAPNSLLNTLFILNMRRSGALAEAVPIVCKFGTTIEQIDALRARMLEYVQSEKREFQGKILTELKDIPDMHSVNVNVVFFYRSNLQNELLRLRRRNMFMCALMMNVAELGIESPNMRWPGQKATAPVFLTGISAEKLAQNPTDPDAPTQDSTVPADNYSIHPDNVSTTSPPVNRHMSTRSRVDFTLGMHSVSADDSSDVFSDTVPRRGNLPFIHRMGSVREDDESEFLQSQPRDSHSIFRRRPLSNASNNSINSASRRGGRSFFSRSHDEPCLPQTQEQGRRGALSVPLGHSPSMRRGSEHTMNEMDHA